MTCHCGRRAKARGLCVAHYHRLRRRAMVPGEGRQHGWYEVYEESEFMYGLGMTEVEVARKLQIQVESLRRSRKRYQQRRAA